MEKKKGETAYVPKLFTPRNEARDIFRAAPRAATGGGFWRWGSDNLYPYALAQMFRRSTTHRRIVNDRPIISPARVLATRRGCRGSPLSSAA